MQPGFRRVPTGAGLALASSSRGISAESICVLIAQSFAARFDDPAKMLRLARTAAACADALSRVERTSSAFDLAAKAHRALGAGLRVAGMFAEAHAAIDRGARYARRGTGDSLIAADLQEERAAVMLRQRRFRGALSLLQRVVDSRRRFADPHALAFVLIRLSVAQNELGEHEAAVVTLTEALPLIDRHEDPRLMLAAAHNLVEFLLDGGQPDKALVAMERADPLYEATGDRLLLLRRQWIHGRIAREVGCPSLAETKLRAALDGYRAADLWYETAFVGLELAHLLVLEGRPEEAASVAGVVALAFDGAGIPAEAMAAKLLSRAAEADFGQRAARLLLRAGSSLHRAHR